MVRLPECHWVTVSLSSSFFWKQKVINMVSAQDRLMSEWERRHWVRKNQMSSSLSSLMQHSPEVEEYSQEHMAKKNALMMSWLMARS